MIEVLVDGGQDHPVGFSPASLPHLVVEPAGRLNKRVRVTAFETPDLDPRMGSEHVKRAVVRVVVKKNVTVDERVVMPEEKSEHRHLVPRVRIEVDPRPFDHVSKPTPARNQGEALRSALRRWRRFGYKRSPVSEPG